MRHIRKLFGLLLGIAAALSGAPATAESRGYVVSGFYTATNLDVVDFKDSCPKGTSTKRLFQIIRDLKSVGYTEEQATTIVSNARDTITLPPDVLAKVETRAVVNGRHVSIYNYPEGASDPNMETVTGRFAYGFDLGSPNTASKFIDPETHQPVDNQWWRAVGCEWTFHEAYPTPPYSEDGTIQAMSESQPGWAIQITGDDLSKDGKVTVSVARTTQHLEVDANGEILRNVSYIIDPSAEHNLFHGEIQNGVLSIEPGPLNMKGSLYGEIALRNAHMRMKSAGDKLTGFWGGYIKWLPLAFKFTSSPNDGTDPIGIYYAIKKMADAAPDPKTGQNTEISITFRLDAVPAYLLAADGTVLARPAAPGAPGLGGSSSH